MSENDEKTGIVRRFVERIVDVASTYPIVVLLLMVGVIGGAGLYAKKYLELRTDLLELLPRESPGFKAFEHQLGRIGGGGQLIVVVDSPDRAANEKFIDALAVKLNEDISTHKACEAKCGPPDRRDGACMAACGPNLINYIEAGTKDVRKFYQDNKWLYADMSDLVEADKTLERQIALRSGLVENLLEDDPKPAPAPVAGDAGAAAAGDAGAKAVGPKDEKKPSLGMDPYRDKWEAAGKKNDEFPTGYFCTQDGRFHGLRIVSTTTGTGDAQSEILIHQVEKMVGELKPASFHKDMKWGLAGNIPNAQAEKESVASDAVWATLLATIVILAGVVYYFRSIWSLVIMGLPAAFGVSTAYAFATATFGYVNTAGLFLGAIILGNGINYPIVLFGRYREFRARGMSPTEARRGAVWNAFRAEFVGSLVASIAYGSLSVTRFRGFSQFGAIGFVGMLLVWLSIIPAVPALVAIIERIEAKVPFLKKVPFFSIEPRSLGKDGSTGPAMRTIATVTERAPWPFIVLAVVATSYLGYRSIDYLRDPWEYNFSNLGSQSKTSGQNLQEGPGYWSIKADDVFGGKMNIAGAQLLADNVAQVDPLKQAILEADKRDPEGQLIEKITTVWDLLPGTEAEQKKKLVVLDSIRDRLTDGVIQRMPEGEQQKLREMRPPETLKALQPTDLPPILQRRFQERDGRLGTLLYVKFKDLKLSDGHIALRIAATTTNVKLPDNTVVQTAHHSTIYAEMINSMRRDGPLATAVSFIAVTIVVIFATSSARGAFVVLCALLMGVICTVGGAAIADARLHYINFIAFPITFGIGCEYPFNVFDRTRILKGDITTAVRRTAGAVALCSFTTTVGYGALLFNDFGALQSFGKLAMAGEIACIVAALFVVPSLLHVLRKKVAGGGGAPAAPAPEPEPKADEGEGEGAAPAPKATESEG